MQNIKLSYADCLGVLHAITESGCEGATSVDLRSRLAISLRAIHSRLSILTEMGKVHRTREGKTFRYYLVENT